MTHRPILAVAPNGAYKQKSDHPELPINIDEIVDCTIQAQQAGASLLHLHIRDQQNRHTLDANTYRHTIDAIHDALGDLIIIQITSEAANIYTSDEQIKCIKTVNPECVSIALREIIPDRQSIPDAQALFHWCAEYRCRIQFVLYDEKDLLRYFNYIDQGVIPDVAHSILFVLGRYARKQQSSIEDLEPFLRHQHKFIAPWTVCAFGALEQACLIEAAHRGGHMRQGFENNLLRPNGALAENNAQQLVETAHAVLEQGMQLTNTGEARKLLGIR